MTYTEREVRKILAMSDEEVMAEHVALYNGDKRLADKSIDMMHANFEALIAERRTQ
jgi:hypothetical protein